MEQIIQFLLRSKETSEGTSGGTVEKTREQAKTKERESQETSKKSRTKGKAKPIIAQKSEKERANQMEKGKKKVRGEKGQTHPELAAYGNLNAESRLSKKHTTASDRKEEGMDGRKSERGN